MHLFLSILGCGADPVDVDTFRTDADADTDADTDTDADADSDTDADADADADTDTDTDTDTVTPGMFYGTLPAKPVPLPKFIATNLDGSRRTPPDLVGHPSVLWFYPAAGTAG